MVNVVTVIVDLQQNYANFFSLFSTDDDKLLKVAAYLIMASQNGMNTFILLGCAASF